MPKFNVYADGVFWGEFEAPTADEAIQKAANELGTIDIGETEAGTEGLSANPAD